MTFATNKRAIFILKKLRLKHYVLTILLTSRPVACPEQVVVGAGVRGESA